MLDSGCSLIFRFGFTVPIPASVIILYMGIVTLALVAYVTSDRERRTASPRRSCRWCSIRAKQPLLARRAGARCRRSPSPASGSATARSSRRRRFGRTIHPAPPDIITVHDKSVDLVKGHNPLRELETTNPEQFKQHLANGRKTTTRTASSATATTWPATACSSTA